jgi:hypothetical protein
MTARVRPVHAFARALAIVAALATLTAPRVAAAEDPPRRELPDYQGRPSPGATPGEVLLWIPRIIFSPIYFVTEFLIRRPLGFLISAAERANVPAALYDFFAFGPDHKIGFAPLVFVDFGFKPSVGIYGFWDDAFFKGNDLRVHASTFGADWLAASLTDRIGFWGKKSLTFAGLAVTRPDHVYYGLGPNTLESSQSRYGEDQYDASATLDVPLWRSSRIQTSLGVRGARFRNGHYGEDPTVSHQVATGVFPALPPGFLSGYTAQMSRVLVALDTRRPYPEQGSGIRLEARGLLASDLTPSPAFGWTRVDAGAAGYVDLNGHRRVVSLAVEASIADPIGSGQIPFTELVTLGGDNAPMPGLFPGRLVDRSAAVAELRYRWPIGPFLSGSLQAAVGNVFGVHLEDFDPKLLRFSGALGLESDVSPDNAIHFLIGFGTETFDHGGQIDSFRLAFGTSRF